MTPRLSIQVPPSAWPHLLTIVEASLGDVRKAVDYLIKAQPLPDVEDLSEQCAQSTGIALPLAESVVTLAVNFSRLARESESQQSLSEAFSLAIKNAEINGWDEEKQRLWEEREGIMRSLWQEGGILETMSKARELLFEFQCVLRRSALLTDVRPVYNREATRIDGALILHTLSLDYIEGDSWRQIHLTLSPKDVETLIDQLQRAQRKQQVSHELLNGQNVPELTPKRNT